MVLRWDEITPVPAIRTLRPPTIIDRAPLHALLSAGTSLLPLVAPAASASFEPSDAAAGAAGAAPVGNPNRSIRFRRFASSSAILAATALDTAVGRVRARLEASCQTGHGMTRDQVAKEKRRLAG